MNAWPFIPAPQPAKSGPPTPLLPLVTALLALAVIPLCSAPAEGRHGVVATVHPLASDAALQAMKHGGNAIDAAVAAALTLGVVDGHNSGIGGGCFLLIRLADGTFAAIDGRETAPGAATRDMFLSHGKAETQLSLTGALACGVPGSLAAYDLAIRRYGKLALKQHLVTAANIAEVGFRLDRSYAGRLAATAGELKQFEASRAAFLREDGAACKTGEVLKLPDLGRTYRLVAEQGIDWFYRGPFARAAGDWMKQNGVVLNNQMDDFSAQPGATNFFGLVGAQANAIAPGKRPLSSMSPTIVLQDGRPILAVGAAGGPTIISQTLLAILHTIDFGMPVEAALAQPRFHHQWKPDELKIEKTVGAATLRELEKRGHKLAPTDSLGAAQAVAWDVKTKTFSGAADPRGEGRAGEW